MIKILAGLYFGHEDYSLISFTMEISRDATPAVLPPDLVISATRHQNVDHIPKVKKTLCTIFKLQKVFSHSYNIFCGVVMHLH